MTNIYTRFILKNKGNFDERRIRVNKKEYIKRYVLFVISLYFTALGVAFTKQGELGVSPTSSVANVMSYQVPEITLGTWLIIWNCFLIP